MLTRDNDHTEISRRDIDRLMSDICTNWYCLLVIRFCMLFLKNTRLIASRGITDPIGMSGIRLEANFHIITGQITASNNIYRCVERSGMRVTNLTLEPIASSAAVLSDEEKEAGIAFSRYWWWND